VSDQAGKTTRTPTRTTTTIQNLSRNRGSKRWSNVDDYDDDDAENALGATKGCHGV
jgi:hypothetical protein